MYKLRIAFRYLFSKKSTNAINLVTWVSMLGMGVGAFALVIVLSVFNGFEGLVVSLYNSFYPELQVTTASGKFFQDADALRNTISKTSTIETISATLEENAYLQYAGKDYIATVKGVDNNYLKVTSLNDKVKEGSFSLKKGDYDGTVIGANICDALSLNIKGFTEPLIINVPRNGSGTSLSPDDAFYTASVIPTGLFSIQQEFDGKYLFVSLEFMQKLMGEEQQLSAFELKLKKDIDPKAAKKLVQSALGNEYQVKTKYEQKETLYRIMQIERWAVYAILSFIMLIVSFNIIGSLLMIVLEKRKDISILKTMGATEKDIQFIFVMEGILSALIGAGIGILLAIAICLLQMKYGFVKLGTSGSTFVVDAYPVVLKFSDVVLAFFTVVVISGLASFIPSRRAAKGNMEFKL